MLNFTLVCDGTSDLCLTDVITWLMDVHFPERTFRVVPAHEVIPATEAVAVRLARAYQLYQPTVIICHRDAENQTANARITEIEAGGGGLAVPVVAAVPVRMLEAWLLFDEDAIRAAADNKNGTVNLGLPAVAQLENIPDPKAVLFEALRSASELSARRKKRFNEGRARSLLTAHIEDFSPLRQLPAFQRFEEAFHTVVAELPN